MNPTTHPPRRRPHVVALGVVLALVGLLAGCGLRLETPPPAPLTPDAVEVARQRTVTDSLELEALAAAPGADPAKPVAKLRATIVTVAREQVDQLGGSYAAAPPTPTPSTNPTDTPTSAAIAPDADVVARLEQGATQARTDAGTVPDGELSRLLASVSAARFLQARQLAAAAHVTPAPTLPRVTAAKTLPVGVAPSALSALVAGHDEAGYAYEVIAAKLTGEPREAALVSAAAHRARAEAWARRASIAETGNDPRRAAYALPKGLDDPAIAKALARSLPQALAVSYASLVAHAEPGSRTELIDSLVNSAAEAVAWGAPVPAFPGLPEHPTP